MVNLGASFMPCMSAVAGRVRTDMLRNQAHSISAEESVAGQLSVLQNAATFTELNGRFLSYTGEEVPW